ncbi:aminoglycoside phosphotransferase family protein [Vibrio genomosp. F10]|uniref:aminoglycoside phosphotransferase family protein n=1 Tax=Vibrio genomosp. F10 TaxID=723171 RepID=UPI00030DBEC5|nr:aminoglycoside phosphotransferase family protein [Vibrio genomosp. F10]OEF04786.1 choline kinase [Vibrio genomosp. F10 str. 9ZB36]
MTPDYSQLAAILDITPPIKVSVIQPLWGGYGELVRLSADNKSVIVKHIELPKPSCHPKGWNTELSHQRKLHSYLVEMQWYRQYAAKCDQLCYVPTPIHIEQYDVKHVLVMEDLASVGFTTVSEAATKAQISASLKWLAHFHAKHIGHEGEGLWPSGTYWHLQTRPDELEKLADEALKRAAKKIDRILTLAPYQTLVHGDAKLANFCFTVCGTQAAAVDFQYVGKGCAMKDVALFMSSAIDPKTCHEAENDVLNEYFFYLRAALALYQPHLDCESVEAAWRPLFPIAWADFQRFVKGWSPGHWKINHYTESLKERALKQLTEYT